MIEMMEGRQLLSTMTFLVTNTADNGNDAQPLAGSLRAAVVQANSLAGTGNTAVIDFTIAGANGAPQQISLQAPLEPINVPTVFDGTTESGYSATSQTPLVNIDGSFAPSGTVGLDITGGGAGSVVSGLAIGGFSGGVLVDGAGSDYNALIDDYAGTDVTGSKPLANLANGVEFSGGAYGNSALGGVFSGNGAAGVDIDAASGNKVYGNFIGVAADGTTRLGDHIGVQVQDGASANTIGLTGNGNVISGNGWDGLELGNTSGNTVVANNIGTDFTGKLAVANGGSGVAIFGGATNNVVGGTSAAARNIISGNANDGVYVSDPGTSGNTIQFDYIGPDITGERPLSNGTNGVVIQGGASYTYVYNDLISANVNDGVLVSDSSTNNNLLSGDWIGLDGPGGHALDRNGATVSNANGVVINGATSTSVGGDTISGNTFGVIITNGATNNWIVYDQIGTDVAGTGNVGNAADGVIIDKSTGNLVGYDLLAYNGDVGILTEEGSNAGNNSLVSDTFTVTMNGHTFGNLNGTTDSD